MGSGLGHINPAIRRAALVVLFLIGLSIFMYPFVNNWYYQNVANDIIAQYEQAVDADKQADYDAAFAKAEEYNQMLVGQTVPDVFAIREGTSDEEYESYLNVMGNLMMGSVEIPVINVKLPIYHYSDAETLEKGAGHIFGSSLPVGGNSSHSVITAHRGLPTAEMFSNLNLLEEGDKFFLHILDRTLAYEVDQVEVVKPEETRSLAIERGSDLCTLVTCTPYGVNTDRLLVRGHRVDYDEADENVTAFRPGGFLMKLGVAGAGVLLALLLLWLFFRWRRRRSLEGPTSPDAARGAHARVSSAVIDGDAGSEQVVTEAESAGLDGSIDERTSQARHRG